MLENEWKFLKIWLRQECSSPTLRVDESTLIDNFILHNQVQRNDRPIKICWNLTIIFFRISHYMYYSVHKPLLVQSASHRLLHGYDCDRREFAETFFTNELKNRINTNCLWPKYIWNVYARLPILSACIEYIFMCCGNQTMICYRIPCISYKMSNKRVPSMCHWIRVWAYSRPKCSLWKKWT